MAYYRHFEKVLNNLLTLKKMNASLFYQWFQENPKSLFADSINIFLLMRCRITWLIPLASPVTDQKMLSTYLNSFWCNKWVLLIHHKIIFTKINWEISSFIISFYRVCDFELWKQPWQNGRCIALTMWQCWFFAICRS